MLPLAGYPLQSKSEKDVESIIYPVFGLGIFMKILFTFSFCFIAVPLVAHVNKLRLKVTDSTGLGLKATVALSSEANQYFSELTTSADGMAEIKTLAYGVYRLDIEKQGFSPISNTLEIKSAIPVKRTLQLAIAPINTVIQVSDAGTLLDPNRPSSIMQIGSAQIEDRVASLPGRSVQDLVNSQPGWLYEGNAVLHPRGSEYQTQLVVDGIPLTDNRSPGFGPEIEADDLDSVSVYTAGIPAEYGRKLGGVVELNTRREAQTGLHGQLVLGGGSYDTLQSFGQLQDTWGKNTLAEGKLSLVRLGKLSGYLSYSYMVGNVWFPVTGELFLGDDVGAALSQLSGHFPDSQDQRNTVRTRFQYQVTPRIWLATGLLSGSGLPFEFEGEQSDALAQYGPAVVSRLSFDRGSVDPSLSIQASLGVDIYKGERINSRFQVDGDNLNNRLNIIDFGGLFSGNAIEPARSF
jgi:hypothetical protein